MTLADPTAASRVRPGPVLAVLSLAAFMASLDLFIVNVAFDDIGRDLARAGSGVSLSHLSWVLNGYAIVYAALLVPLGRLADRFGRKRGFLLGLVVFTLASAACAASSGLWELVAFRTVQAAGAALLTPTSLGLLVAATPVAERARAVRIWAATGALASAAGPVLGGLLVAASWRWVFLVNLPVGVLALVAAIRFVPDVREDRSGPVPDLAGAAVLALGIGALALALVQGPDWGWTSTSVVAAFVVAVAAMALFSRRCVRHRAPVVEVELLRVRAFAWSNLTSLVFSVAFAASLLTLVLWMQRVWGFSALQTGLAVAPGPLMVPIFAAVAQRLSRRVPVGRIAAVGCLLLGLGAVVVAAGIGAEPRYALAVLPGWLVGGAGVGLALPTILSSATLDLPADRAATGSAVVNMARQVGSVLGISMLVVLLGSPVGFEATLAAFRGAWWATGAVAAVAAVTALGMTPHGPPTSTVSVPAAPMPAAPAASPAVEPIR